MAKRNSLTLVQKLRHERGYSQEELARRARFSVRTLWQVERRRHVRPSTARKILKALGIRADAWGDYFQQEDGSAMRIAR